MLTERKLTERELGKREEAIKGLMSNKRKLVQKYGKDAEKVMYGIATKQAKKKVENMNLDSLKELIKKSLQKEAGTSTIDTGFSGRADYGEEDKALGREDELEMRGLEEGHGLSQKDIDILKNGFNAFFIAAPKYGEMEEFRRVIKFLLKSNILQDKTKDLSVKEEKEMSSDEIIKIIKMMNPEAKEKFLKKIAKMGKDKVDENVAQSDAVYELRDIVDQLEELGDQARQIVRQNFPNELSRLDGYRAFEFAYSSNRYDTTLGKFVDRLEDGDYDDLDDEDYVNEKMLPLIRKSLAKAPKADKVAKKQKMKLPSGMVNYMDFTKSVAEKLTKKAKVGDFVDDFQKSDAKQFKGKSDKKKKQMAVAAYLSKQND